MSLKNPQDYSDYDPDDEPPYDTTQDEEDKYLLKVYFKLQKFIRESEYEELKPAIKHLLVQLHYDEIGPYLAEEAFNKLRPWE